MSRNAGGDRTRSLYANDPPSGPWLVNLIDRKLEIYREPTEGPEFADGFGYRQRVDYPPTDTVSPFAAPHASVRVADLLP